MIKLTQTHLIGDVMDVDMDLGSILSDTEKMDDQTFSEGLGKFLHY